ncbi:hypothetical protein ACFWPX_30120 [Nocardia sp. NPDC058518]|uniref:hypothetical protein n=1 Tax=Nocardia sp. NPDC058518 TaxID=3346534 RepID=UPI00365A951F
MTNTVSFIEDIDGAVYTEPGECRCPNCATGGEYEDLCGHLPDGCRYRWHTRCQGCDYYGPIRNTERLCTTCLPAYRAETANR